MLLGRLSALAALGLFGVAQASPVSAQDFDFLLGQWSVHNRLLQGRLVHSTDWVEFDAVDAFHPLPGGLGIEESFQTDHWPRFFALGLHLFDPTTRRWSLYWGDNRNSPGTLQLLAVGSFAGDLGTFYASDSLRGKPVTVRILWKRVDVDHAHWEQAFSADSGRTWETNWTMEFERRP